MKDLDVRIGNPDFMAPYWDQVSLPSLIANTSSKKKAYQDSSGIKALKKQILGLHELTGNASTEGRHVIIGSGATQVLAAAMYAGKARRGYIIYAKPPYYFRFPRIAEVAGMALSANEPIGKNFVELITAPSNPLNEVYEPTESNFKIYDLCYNWPQYGKVIKRDEEIMVFGLSKATGHASTRIGWALVKDEDTAKLMSEYMEYSSSGTSIEAQLAASQIIDFQRKAGPKDTVFEFGRDILEMRWRLLAGLKSEKFTIHNSSGMFAWLSYGKGIAVNDLYSDAKILGTSGTGCGGKDSNVRLNVGCSDEKFWELLRRLFAVK